MSDLTIEGLEAGYKGTDVLRGISLHVAPGDCVAVLGPNGAGKSTLLKAISGQLKNRAGTRRLGDTDTTSWRSYKMARAGVRWVGDPRPVFTSLTVDENLEIGGVRLEGDVEAQRVRVRELLPVLADKRREKAGSLSGGQQQMLAIGHALMSNPRFLCLDEPSLGLAAVVVSSLSQLIEELAADGVGIIWAEQFPEVALGHSSRAIVLGAGKIVLEGPSATLPRDELESAYIGAH